MVKLYMPAVVHLCKHNRKKISCFKSDHNFLSNLKFRKIFTNLKYPKTFSNSI